MQRKQFIIYATTATGLLPLLVTQLGCTTGATRAMPGGNGFKVRSSTDNFHRHEIKIMFVDVSVPPVGGKTITSSGPVHTHDVMLAMADYQALQDGAVVIKTSTFDSRHTHTFAIQVPPG